MFRYLISFFTKKFELFKEDLGMCLVQKNKDKVQFEKSKHPSKKKIRDLYRLNWSNGFSRLGLRSYFLFLKLKL